MMPTNRDRGERAGDTIRKLLTTLTSGGFSPHMPFGKSRLMAGGRSRVSRFPSPFGVGAAQLVFGESSRARTSEGHAGGAA